MQNILLVGAGNIGSRYLQGLSSVKLDLCITVVDPSDLSLKKSTKRWLDVGGNKSKHKICWCNELPQDLDLIDLAIITTSAGGRADLITNISKSVRVSYWVLEKVLAQSKEELEQKFKNQQAQAKVAIEKKKVNLKKQQLQKQLQMKTQSLKKQARAGSEQDETR